MTDTTTANDVLIRLNDLWGLSATTGWDEVGPRVLRAVGERPDGQTVSRTAFVEMAAGHERFRAELSAALHVDSVLPEVLIAQAGILAKAVDTAAERADGYEQTARVMNAERLRLHGLAARLLSQFEHGHTTHPGEPCKQPGHTPIRMIEGWREELNRPLPDESEVSTPAGGWLFALSPDRRRIAFYEPDNAPWFIPYLSGKGRFVDRSEIEDWTIFTPGRDRVLPARKPAPVEEDASSKYVKLDPQDVSPALPDGVFLFGSVLGDELDAALDTWAAERLTAHAPQTVWWAEDEKDHVDPQQVVVDRFGELWKPALHEVAYECVSRRGLFQPSWWGLLSENGPLLAGEPFTLNPPVGWMNRVQEVLSYQGLQNDMMFKTSAALSNLVRSWVGTHARDADEGQPPGAHWGPRWEPPPVASTKDEPWPMRTSTVGASEVHTKDLVTGHDHTEWSSPDGRWSVHIVPADMEFTKARDAGLDAIRANLEEADSVYFDPEFPRPVAEVAIEYLEYHRRNAAQANELVSRVHEALDEHGYGGSRGVIVDTVRTALGATLEARAQAARASLDLTAARRQCACRTSTRDELLYATTGFLIGLRDVTAETLSASVSTDDLKTLRTHLGHAQDKAIDALVIQARKG